LEEVKAGQGGTTFLSGSHKAHFNYGGPDRYRPNISGSPWEANIRAVMDEYSCPAGSAVIFTESLIHAANDWTNPDNPRCAVFNLTFRSFLGRGCELSWPLVCSPSHVLRERTDGPFQDDFGADR
jgi:ectoine hydroxylase-related dioxygenase (phytanoyl-CoA dioxygenase family)